MTYHYIYFLESLKNNKVYVGRTDKSPEHRVEQHNKGTNTWTKANGPFKLLYYEVYSCNKDAVLRERFYKTGFGKRIKKLIADDIRARSSVG